MERKIAKLDDDKKGVSEKLLTVTERVEATRLHGELAKLNAELATLEEGWLALSAELESD